MSEEIPGGVRLQFAQFLALADTRCHAETHKDIVDSPECETCHHTIVDYLMVVPRVWPA